MTQLPRPLSRPDLLRDACYIDGKWVGAGSGPAIAVDNPSTGKTIVSVPKLGRKETEQAIASANAALPAWSAKTGKERAAILLKWAQLMMQHQQDLATIMTAEQGKPVTEAAGEIAYAASFLEWFGEEAKRIDGDVLQSPKAGQRLLALKQPIGVTAAITPWNFPAAMITRKVGPALAALGALQDVAVDALGFFGEPFQERRGVGDLAGRFGDRLALLGRHDGGQVLLVGHHQLGPFQQDRAAFLAGLGGPGGQGGGGAGDGLLGFLAPQLGHRDDGLAGGGVVDRDGGGAAGADPFPVDVAGVAQQLSALERMGQLRHECSLIWKARKRLAGPPRPGGRGGPVVVRRMPPSGGQDIGEDIQGPFELGIRDGQGIQEAQYVSVYTAA